MNKFEEKAAMLDKLAELINVGELIKMLECRKDEIVEGLNLMTAMPVYVVMDKDHVYSSGHSQFTNYDRFSGEGQEYGYIDSMLDSEDREFKKSKEGMEAPIPLTKSPVSHPVAFFLTSSGANSYIDYQRHNMKNPFLFVFNSGYSNKEFESVFKF